LVILVRSSVRVCADKYVIRRRRKGRTCTAADLRHALMTRANLRARFSSPYGCRVRPGRARRTGKDLIYRPCVLYTFLDTFLRFSSHLPEISSERRVGELYIAYIRPGGHTDVGNLGKTSSGTVRKKNKRNWRHFRNRETVSFDDRRPAT